MATVDYIQTIIVICLFIYGLFLLINFLSNREAFESVSTPDDIINELNKQRSYIESIKGNRAYNQISAYLPHIDIMKKFEKSTSDMLSGLTEQIKTHTAKKTEELNRMSNLIYDMEKYAANDLVKKYQDRKLKAVKSHNNGLELGIIKPDNAIDSYMLSVNGQCLSVPADNNYDVMPCNKDDPNQKFSIDYIYNDGQYKNRLDPGYPKLENIGKVRYPFVFVRAATNKNCVKNSHGQLSVEPCREYVGQRWAPIKGKVAN